MSYSRWFIGLVVLATGCAGTSHHSAGVVAGAAVASTANSSSTTPPSTGPTATSSTAAVGTVSHPAASSAPGVTTTLPVVKGAPNRPGSGPAPARAGTYRYRQTGSATVGSSSKPVPPEGTLTIDAASADGNQVWHRSVDPSGPPSDTTFAYRNGGVFILQTVMRTNAGGQQTSFTCTFTAPLPAPPWPPRTGSTFQGHADCGQFTVDAAGKVTGERDVTLDGSSHHVFVLTTNLTFHGQLEGSGTQTDWLDPASSLVLHEETSDNGKYGGVFAFSAQTTSDLLSAKPQ